MRPFLTPQSVNDIGHSTSGNLTGVDVVRKALGQAKPAFTGAGL
jgi:hypothetical protein